MHGGMLYDRYISTHFGKLHKGTSKEFRMYNKYFRKNYLRFLPKRKDAKILDIGCGMGHFLYFLQQEGHANYLGVDISGENIDFCKSKGFKAVKDDAVKFLEKHKSRFDAIVMNDVLEHFDKDKIIDVLNSARESLATGGKIIIKVLNCSNPIVGLSCRYTDFTHEIGFTELSLAQILEVCGFKEIAIYPQDIFIFYLNPFNYIAKFANAILNCLFWLLFRLYGRKCIRIFTKSMIGAGIKA